MKQINNYIAEKLHIGKDTKGYDGRFDVTDDDMKYPKEVLNDRIFKTSDLNPVLLKKRALQEYIAFMLLTHSKPYIFKGKINSIPGNYCKDLVDNILERDKNISVEDIIFAYDMNKDNYDKELPNNLRKEYCKRIASLVGRALPENALFDLDLYEDWENYSDKTRKLLNERNGIIALPFKLTYKGKSIDCEIAYRGMYTYYHYRVKDKNYNTVDEFIQSIEKEFKV